MDPKYVYLNLQQQVGKNKKDIEDLRTVKFALERAGVRVVGEEASASDLPDPITYGGEPGDAYLIGTEAPFDMYVFTQPSVGETNYKWFNIGAFPAIGPQGEQGLQGEQGPQGDASNWRFGTVNPSILETDKIHDGYLNTTSGMVYEFDGERWIAIGSIKGPSGPQGIKGDTGEQGEQGIKGDTGDRGPSGIVIEVIGVVANTGSLPEPTDVARNAGYIVDDGVDEDLYIIVEDENQDLIWYNAGSFTGTPGIAATISGATASITKLSMGALPGVQVTVGGTSSSRSFGFNFRLPLPSGDIVDSDDAPIPSSIDGWTQDIISKRTLHRIYTSLASMGLTGPVTTQQIIAALYNASTPNVKYHMVMLQNQTNFETISDAPKAKGQLFITQGSPTRNYDVRYIDDSYNVYIYAGASGTPEVASWFRLLTTHDAEIVGSPAGGTTGQILAKKSDDDFDTKWEDVPNAPNGTPEGGTTGQMLVKKSGTDYDEEWADVPNGVPNGGTQGQILVKQSNADGDSAWANAPVGLPSEGTTGQALKKKTNTNFDVEWDDVHEVPSGGTTGQVLTKASDNNYDATWQTPSAGGGGAFCLAKNLLINHDFKINQRSVSGVFSQNNKYMHDRWISGPSTSTYNLSVAAGSITLSAGGEFGQYIECDPIRIANKKMLIIFNFPDTDVSSMAFEVGFKYYNGSSWVEEKTSDITFRAHGTSITNRSQGFAILSPSLMTPASTYQYIYFFIRRTDSYATGIGIVDTYCGLYESITSSDIPSGVRNALAITPSNQSDEIEKCMYYYQKAKTGNTAAAVTSVSYTDGVITMVSISARYESRAMRVNPTKEIGNSGAIWKDITGTSHSLNIISSDTEFVNIIGNSYATVKRTSLTTTEGFLTAYFTGVRAFDAEIYPS